MIKIIISFLIIVLFSSCSSDNDNAEPDNFEILGDLSVLEGGGHPGIIYGTIYLPITVDVSVPCNLYVSSGSDVVWFSGMTTPGTSEIHFKITNAAFQQAYSFSAGVELTGDSSNSSQGIGDAIGKWLGVGGTVLAVTGPVEYPVYHLKYVDGDSNPHLSIVTEIILPSGPG